MPFSLQVPAQTGISVHCKKQEAGLSQSQLHVFSAGNCCFIDYNRSVPSYLYFESFLHLSLIVLHDSDAVFLKQPLQRVVQAALYAVRVLLSLDPHRSVSFSFPYRQNDTGSDSDCQSAVFRYFRLRRRCAKPPGISVKTCPTAVSVRLCRTGTGPLSSDALCLTWRILP